jgi:hypothetical protein
VQEGVRCLRWGWGHARGVGVKKPCKEGGGGSRGSCAEEEGGTLERVWGHNSHFRLLVSWGGSGGRQVQSESSKQHIACFKCSDLFGGVGASEEACSWGA